MISVLILARNEEKNIPNCLESVKGSDDIVVLDDGSSDRTVEIAQAFGARVIQHSAGGERTQREYSLRSTSFKYPWVYNPDADEVTPPELWEEMVRVVSDTSRAEVAYRVRFKVMFMDRWVRRCSLYPTWVVRLFRPEALTFERETNLTYHVKGQTGYLQNHFFHYSFNKGLSAWFDKHNRYSDGEAREALRTLETSGVDWRDIFSFSEPARRRKALKAAAWYIPFRASLVFLYLYFVRLGFLDGVAGWRYCSMRAMYEYMIDLKVVELKRRAEGKTM